MKGLAIAMPIAQSPLASPFWANPDRTVPGCRQFAVIPVPSSRCASSVVNKMLASLERA